MDGLEGVLAILGIVSGSDVKQFVADRRSDDFLIIVACLDAAQEFLQAQTHRGSFRQPHGQTLAYRIGEHEQVHFFSDLTMVAFLGFFQQNEVFVQHFLLRESYTVDTRHHLAVFLSAPVSTSHRHQFDGLDRCSGSQVRTTAQVGECTLRIGGDMSVFQFGNQFALIGFSTVAELLQRIRFRNVFSYYGLFLGCQFRHFRFDSRQVRLFDCCFARIYIIVESVFDGRTDTELDARIELLQSFGQQVGAGVPEGMLSLFVFPLVEHKLCILFDRTS